MTGTRLLQCFVKSIDAFAPQVRDSAATSSTCASSLRCGRESAKRPPRQYPSVRNASIRPMTFA